MQEILIIIIQVWCESYEINTILKWCIMILMVGFLVLEITFFGEVVWVVGIYAPNQAT